MLVFALLFTERKVDLLVILLQAFLVEPIKKLDDLC